MIEFTYEGEPLSKERVNYNPKTKSFYTPSKTKRYEKDVRTQFIEQVGNPELSGLLLADLAFTDDGFFLTLRELGDEWARRYGGRDLDNMVKAVGDALNGVAYKDDAQIGSLMVSDLWIPA